MGARGREVFIYFKAADAADTPRPAAAEDERMTKRFVSP
jgi:hypothetical protein